MYIGMLFQLINSYYVKGEEGQLEIMWTAK